MRLRKLCIKNFRGIREMEWTLCNDMACLIGPGDSTKSTILLALEFLFSPSWNLAVSDTDFYQMNVDIPIEISGIITDLPDSMITEDEFGLYLGFWNTQDGKFYEEQQDEKCHAALQVQLLIRKDLEPKWNVVSLQAGGREPQAITAADRKALGVTRIGSYTDSDLTWGRNSALSRLTQKDDISQIPGMLASAERNILESLKGMDFSALSQAVVDFEQAAQSLGIDAQEKYRAGVDPVRVNLRQGAIALLDGKLPLSLRGAGSRRLMAMAIHKASVKEGAVILVDEIESNLEPHRLRHLIRQLRPTLADKHQVIFTTHSSVAVVECKAEANELYVVRSLNGGKTIVTPVREALQKIVRSIPEAFLARKVVVCEGKTEAGLLIGLDKHYWEDKHSKSPTQHKYRTMAEAGVAPIESPSGGGDEAPTYAMELVKLGYQVAFFGDSDKLDQLKPSIAEMKKSGIEVIVWEKENNSGVSIEERLCLDLPLKAVGKLVELAVDLNDEQSVWSKIYEQLPVNTAVTKDNKFESLVSEVEENSLRACIGEAAKKVQKGKKADRGWFKRRDKGEDLGRLLADWLGEMQSKPTMETLQALEKWCYE